MAQAKRNTYQQVDPSKALVPIQQSLVKSEPEFKRLAVAAGRGMQYHTEMNFALSLIRENELLQKCDPESFVEAFENLGAMGLSLNRSLGHAALVPRWNKKRKKNWAMAMPMYRGYISLATGGSVIKNVWGAVVVEGDEIEVTLGSAPSILHRPLIAKRGEVNRRPNFANMMGSFCIADIAGSVHPHCTWLSIDDICSIAERSDSFNPKPRDEWVNGEKTGKQVTPKPSGPWVTDPGEMALKSAFRRAFKTWPGIDKVEYTALQEAVRVDTAAEISDHDEDSPAAIEGEATDVTENLCAKEVEELESLCIAKKIRPTRMAQAYGKENLSELPAALYLELKARITKAGK